MLNRNARTRTPLPSLDLLVGFEAATLRRFALARRRWKNLGIVVGDDLETAERRFFETWVRDAGLDGGWPPSSTQRAAAMPAILRPGRSGREVIGLFPHPGGPR